MTTKDEALKLALEALESCSAGDYSMGHIIHPSFDVEAVNKAIEAIDEALAEQPAQGCDYCNHPLYAGIKCRNCGREQPAQQPLTDEQWQQIAAITGCARIEKRGRDAILRVLQEAAHGIKGGA